MSDADDYESLPPATPLSVSATAGAMAGIAEHCAMFPVDSVKTRMQSLSCSKQRSYGITQMLSVMVKEEGIFRPVRGMNAMAVGAGPAHAMYFTCIEMGREAANQAKVPTQFGEGFAAVFATVCHDAVMTPADVVKQRMQMCCSPFTSSFNCMSTVFRTEGISAFYRAYPTQLLMNIPFQASLVVTYGMTQRFLNPDERYNPSVHFVAGAISGGVASTITMPLDVCKTLLNTQEMGVLAALNRKEIKGLFGAAQVVYQMTGLTGFFSGLSARVLYQAPATAISWSVYEFFKYYMKLNSVNSDDNKYDTVDTIGSSSGTKKYCMIEFKLVSTIETPTRLKM